MKKILLLASLAAFAFASSDIYDIDNAKYIKDKKSFYIKKADSDKEKIKCVNSAKEVKHMKKCFK